MGGKFQNHLREGWIIRKGGEKARSGWSKDSLVWPEAVYRKPARRRKG